MLLRKSLHDHEACGCLYESLRGSIHLPLLIPPSFLSVIHCHHGVQDGLIGPQRVSARGCHHVGMLVWVLAVRLRYVSSPRHPRGD